MARYNLTRCEADCKLVVLFHDVWIRALVRSAELSLDTQLIWHVHIFHHASPNCQVGGCHHGLGKTEGDSREQWVQIIPIDETSLADYALGLLKCFGYLWTVSWISFSMRYAARYQFEHGALSVHEPLKHSLIDFLASKITR